MHSVVSKFEFVAIILIVYMIFMELIKQKEKKTETK